MSTASASASMVERMMDDITGPVVLDKSLPNGGVCPECEDGRYEHGHHPCVAYWMERTRRAEAKLRTMAAAVIDASAALGMAAETLIGGDADGTD